MRSANLVLRQISPTVIVLVGLVGGCQRTPEPAPQPNPQASVAEQPVRRTHPPLPAPGSEGGVSAHHGGLLQRAGAGYLELVASSGDLRVYLYDSAGQPISLGNAHGSAKLEWTDGGIEVALTPAAAEPTALMAPQEVPNLFTADIDVTVGETHYATRIRYAQGGAAGATMGLPTTP